MDPYLVLQAPRQWIKFKIRSYSKERHKFEFNTFLCRLKPPPRRLLCERGPTFLHRPDDDCNKRRRLDTTDCAFSIPNNDDDPAAENPPLFLKHTLREEQLRSLGWMLSQEKLQGNLRGGLLADRMGFGKTSASVPAFQKRSSIVTTLCIC